MNSIQKNKFCVVLINFLLASLLIFAFSAQSAMAADESPTVQNQVSDVDNIDSGTIFTSLEKLFGLRFVNYVKAYIARNSKDDKVVKKEQPVEKKVVVKEVKKEQLVEKKVVVKEVKKAKPVEKKVVVKEKEVVVEEPVKQNKKVTPKEDYIGINKYLDADAKKLYNSSLPASIGTSTLDFDTVVIGGEIVAIVNDGVVEGLKDGVAKTYYKNGKLKTERSYVGRRLNGSVKIWDEEGELVFEGAYKKGRPEGLHKGWKYGKLTSKKTYINGKIHGLSESWSPSGDRRLLSTGKYVNGEEIGLHQEWYRNGDFRRKGEYVNGLRIGLHQRWHNNGQLNVESNYNKNGKAEGSWQEWSKDGQLELSGTYKNGKSVEENIFYESGKKKAKILEQEEKITCWYENGEVDADCSSI